MGLKTIVFMPGKSLWNYRAWIKPTNAEMKLGKRLVLLIRPFIPLFRG